MPTPRWFGRIMEKDFDARECEGRQQIDALRS
jgi:hypothetical protein